MVDLFIDHGGNFFDTADFYGGFGGSERRILTICSSVNLVFFMSPSLPEGPLSQSINWTENPPSGDMLDALTLSRLLLNRKSSSEAIAAYEGEMFERKRHMTADTMVNTEMFYAPDACDRVVALFRSFGGAETVLSAAKA